MKYITLSDMASVIYKNIHKIPHDIDLVVGIPRSGMIAASMICGYLNRPLVDVDNFCNGCFSGVGGGRLKYVKDRPIRKVLVVDDTIGNGGSMREAKEKIGKLNKDFEYVYFAVYLEGNGINDINLFFEDIRHYVTNHIISVLYEWNVFQHNNDVMGYSMYDLDGVLCIDPPDEINTMEYENYISNAIPKFTPVTTIGIICTYRLEKYRDVTEKWLSDNDIKYNRLIMFPANTYSERAVSGMSPEQYKADMYKNEAWYMQLFVESDDFQAKRIYEMTKKPVLSVERNIMYGSE